MKKTLFVFIFCFRLLVTAQTGPAGVGTSASNVFWLKANAGTSSSVNNTAISSWNDQSGNGLNMTQTTTAQQPSFSTNVMNGFPAILFDNVNGSGLNDKMLGPDSPILDNTSGYTFFTVTRPMNYGDAHVIVSKRTTVSVDQSFMLFYYTGNKLWVDIQTTNDRFSSNGSFTTATNYLFDVVYDGNIANPRVNVYSEESLDIQSNETSTLVPDNASPIILGTTDAGDPRPFGGYIAEVIIYREALVPARRIIVNNHLSAKYNIALSANDKYAGDNSGNGDYDYDVAGIGQESTGSNTSFSASACGGMAITASGGLDNTDYLLAGHATATNSVITTDVVGLTGINKARWQRIWYLDVTNTAATQSVNLEFDLSDGGLPGTPLGAGNYRLLYRAGLSGAWTEMATASSISGDKILFNNLAISADGYYTIGSIDYFSSPLPVMLLDFKALPVNGVVKLTWSTASEKNCDYFTVEKSRDGEVFEKVVTAKGAGTSLVQNTYAGIDPQPYEGLSYYRLRQTDFDNSSASLRLVAVNNQAAGNPVRIYPNPSEGIIHIEMPGNDQDLQVTVNDENGKHCWSRSYAAGNYDRVITLDAKELPAKGIYVITVLSGHEGRSTQKIIIK